MKNILLSAKNLLSNSILLNSSELKKLNNEGNQYSLYKCDGCKKLFNSMGEEIICAFGCGHKFHEYCAEYQGELECRICQKNEVDNNETNPSIIARQTLHGRETTNVDGVGRSDRYLTENVNKSKMNNSLDRLRAFDKHYAQKDFLVRFIVCNK